MSNYLSVKELSQLTDVKPRKLLYYDQIGLLKPSNKTHHNHRLYVKSDVEKLQQITTLQGLQFPSDQIKKIMSATSQSVKQFLHAQKRVIQERKNANEKIERLLDSLIFTYDQEGVIDWKIQSEIVKTLESQSPDKNNWHHYFLTSAEEKEFNTLAQQRTPEYWVDYQTRWAVLFKEVEENLRTDPEGEIGFGFAKRWFDLVSEVYKNNRALGNKLWEGYKAGIISDSTLPYHPAVMEYMAKAKKKYLEITSQLMGEGVDE